MKSFYRIILFLCIFFIYTGCVYKPLEKSKITRENYKNMREIVSDVFYSKTGFPNREKAIKYNYKDSFIQAANITIKNGFEYFSIYEPSYLINQYKNNKVKDALDAYKSCIKGEGSFTSSSIIPFINNPLHVFLPIPNIYSSKFHMAVSYCDSIVDYSIDRQIFKNVHHYRIKYKILMHDKKVNDHITFNAKETIQALNLLKM